MGGASLPTNTTAVMETDVCVELTLDGYPTTIEPFDKGWLKVSDIHEIYYEVSGKVGGNPVLYVHGGPGSGCSASCRRYFDPNVYRVILMDQRGSGKSKPSAELKDNTTWDLVDDIEKLRTHLGIDRWVVFGGSWGSTLSLVYAIKHTDRVKALILRGIFTGRREEALWLYQEGASFLFPDYWKDFVSTIPLAERGDMISSYYRRLTSDDPEECLKAARTWAQWECRISTLICDNQKINTRLENEQWVKSFARIECHYFTHGCWFDDPEYILQNVGKITSKVPGIIVQGRYDVVCPMKTAWDLHEKWPEAEFHIIKDGGHSVMDTGIKTALIAAAEKYKNSV